MREATPYYLQALEAAWQAIQEKLYIVKRKLGVEGVELEGVTYDGDSDLSQIDELPDDPISSRFDHAEVSIRLEAYYRIVRKP